MPARICNAADLGSTKKARHAISILEEGLAAADPARIITPYVGEGVVRVRGSDIKLDEYDALYTVAMGKAADAMSRAASRILDVKSGIVVIPRDSKSATRSRRFAVYRAEHPHPGRGSVVAAKAVHKFVKNRREGDFVLFLVSGGASSLLALPDGVTLDDKMYAAETLLRCGASISEINCVRKHISAIKGGRLIEDMACTGASLIMSDVEGDDPTAIASGLTHMDESTFDDALNVISQYDIGSKMPPTVMDRLYKGVSGAIPETPKTARIPHQIIANNRTCLEAMAAKAAAIGYDVASSQYYGEIAPTVEHILDHMQAGRCLVFGGEPRVRVSGRGRGGRSQEMVLRAGLRLGADALVASMGTDGIDGNTTAAGAMQEGPVTDTSHALSHIERNDSHAYFSRYGGLIMTGHTGTNLLDIGVALVGRPSSKR